MAGRRIEHLVDGNVEKKQCCTCKAWKSLESFNRNKSKWDGLESRCRACCKREHELNGEKRYRAYYEANREKIGAKTRAYWVVHGMEEYGTKYRKENPEAGRVNAERWRKRHPEEFARLNRRTARKYRAMKREVRETFSKDDEKFTRDSFNDTCFNCGSTCNLCIDHHRPLSKGFALSKENAVLLCRRCNSSKGSKDPEQFYTEEQLKELRRLLKSKV